MIGVDCTPSDYSGWAIFCNVDVIRKVQLAFNAKWVLIMIDILGTCVDLWGSRHGYQYMALFVGTISTPR